MSKLGVQQSILSMCLNLTHYKNKQIFQQRKTKKNIDIAH